MNVQRRLVASVLFLSIVAPLQAQTYRTDPNPAGAMNGFGGSVAVAGGAVFVGEPANTYSPGMVYVYQLEADAWTVQSELTASDAENGDSFGGALAAEDNTLLIGATGTGSEPGRAYVFQHSDDAWTEIARLTSDESLAEDGFGNAVSLDGSVALVGAPGQNDNTGAVYVFRRNPATGAWTEEAKLTGSDVQPGAMFGTAVALQGETAFVGAPEQGGGSLYVFQYDTAAKEWSEAAQLAGSEAGEEDDFGSTIALKGEDVLVGAPRHGNDIGAVYGFRRNDDASNGWEEQARLTPPDGAPQHRFGSAIAVNGNDVWIGAPGAARFTGVIYLYETSPEDSAWTAPVQLRTNDVYTFGFFAGTVAAEGDVAAASIVGADYGAGRVVIFQKDPETGAWQERNTLLSEPRGLTSITGDRVNCSGGEAALFSCESVDLISFLSIQDLGGGRGVRLNDVWGWTDGETGKEYAIVGRVDGTSFVDISDPSHPVFAGDLPMTEGSRGSTWRDMKVYRDHVFIVADNAGEHGMQVFDLRRLRSLSSLPARFTETALYRRINSAHNIVVNTETGFAYTVGNSGGGETCGGGLHMIDIREPATPEFAGCFSDPSTGRMGTGYTHDAQCVLYAGPDEEHQGREICFGSNETALSIADVTDKARPVALSSATYPSVSYTHQGWITEDHRYFFVNDELDELSGGVAQTRTLIWDVVDLDDPQLVKEYTFGTESSDHNLYVRGRYMYQSNYGSGLRIHDIGDPVNPVEVGYFDTTPLGGNGPGFDGSWSNYPFFESGIIAVSSIGEGLFLVKRSDPEL